MSSTESLVMPLGAWRLIVASDCVMWAVTPPVSNEKDDSPVSFGLVLAVLPMRRKLLRYLRKNENAESGNSRRRALTRGSAAIPQTKKAPPVEHRTAQLSSGFLRFSSSGALSGALAMDPELERLVDAWPLLSVDERQLIVDMAARLTRPR